MKIVRLLFFIFIGFNAGFANNNVVGSYTNRTVDTISYLAILPDKTFCLSYTGGNLDLLLAGNWEIQGNNIVLKEVRQSQDMYMVFGLSDPKTKDRIIKVSGRTLSYGTGTIFGISKDESMPKMKLILEENYNGFYENYPFALSNYKNENIFIGLPIRHLAENKVEYKMYNFKLDTPNVNTFRVFFNRDAIRKSFELNATFKNNKLTPDGALNSYDGFTKDKESLDKKSIDKIKKSCIEPAFAKQTNINSSLLKPIKVFNVIMKKPTEFYFKMDDEYRD